jgi:hypothetical protein
MRTEGDHPLAHGRRLRLKANPGASRIIGTNPRKLPAFSEWPTIRTEAVRKGPRGKALPVADVADRQGWFEQPSKRRLFD